MSADKIVRAIYGIRYDADKIRKIQDAYQHTDQEGQVQKEG